MGSVFPIEAQFVTCERTRLRVREGAGWADVFAVVFGLAITLVVGSYQFGRSNHTVYLLDAMHKLNPALLANDWFTTQTFQYHALFGLLTRTLAGILEPAFLIRYLGLALAMHVGWFQLTRLLGGGRVSYMLSVLLLYVSGAGTALGVYSFLQDSAFLPSNIASVALLWGIVSWLRRRLVTAGVMFAVASLFHLNYAVIAPVLWVVMWCYDAWLSARRRDVAWTEDEPDDPTVRPWMYPAMWLGTALAIVPAAGSVLMAMQAMPTTGTPLPFDEFVDLYVRLRHPHHYDPLSWPIVIWVSFLWPTVPALFGTWRVVRDVTCSGVIVATWQRTAVVFLFFMTLIGVAVVFAGWTFVDERLVQMSLFRFSIYPHLLACIAASVWLCEATLFGRPTRAVVAAIIPLLITVVAVVALRSGRLEVMASSPSWQFQQISPTPIKLMAALSFVPLLAIVVDHTMRRREQIYCVASVALAAFMLWGWTEGQHGLVRTPDDPAFAKVAQWARKRVGTSEAPVFLTPQDAVFLVPPDEETFRLAARRAIVVNYKGVPQTSRELGAWRDRLRDVLALPHLRLLPRPMPATLAAIRQRYDELPAEHLVSVARKYGARYVVATRKLAHPQITEVFATTGKRTYVVYDLGDPGKGDASYR